MKRFTLINGTLAPGNACMETTALADAKREIALFLLREDVGEYDLQHRFLSLIGTKTTLAFLARRGEAEFAELQSYAETVMAGLLCTLAAPRSEFRRANRAILDALGLERENLVEGRTTTDLVRALRKGAGHVKRRSGEHLLGGGVPQPIALAG